MLDYVGVYLYNGGMYIKAPYGGSVHVYESRLCEFHAGDSGCYYIRCIHSGKIIKRVYSMEYVRLATTIDYMKAVREHGLVKK